MAAAKTDKPQNTAQTKILESPGFGAYGAVATSLPDLTMAVDKMPESKINGSLDFTDSDKRWLKDLGITTSDPNSYHKVWEDDYQRDASQHRTWANTYGGRVGMRAISRGIVGAAFYAAGGMYSSHKMEGFNVDKVPENTLQHIARFIDNTAGKAIQWSVKTAHHGNPEAEEKAFKSVLFRDTINYGNSINGKSLNGRTLGHEAMAVTFDFASMSFGDYMTRYALGLVDPNAKKRWIKDGHIDLPGGLKDLLYNMFRGVSYAAGEDMAVAIPYVFGMRAQRNLINKGSPGFKYDVDMGLNGGSYKVRDGKVVGDYQIEGMADLMGRFSWYNVGTKMFRDAYGKAQSTGEKFYDRWKAGDHSMPHIELAPDTLTPAGLRHKAAEAVRYVVRTTTKVMAYMLPATTFFFISRSPQSKVRGIAIDVNKNAEGILVDKGVLVHKKPVQFIADSGKMGGVSAHDDRNFSSGFTKDRPVTPGSNFNNKVDARTLEYVNAEGVRTPTAINPFDFAGSSRSRKEALKDSFYEQSPWYSPGVNLSGKASDSFGTGVDHMADGTLGFLGRRSKTMKRFIDSIDPKDVELFSRRYANAALAYTPYFMMKTDVLSAEWDTKRTDMALDRTLDGIGHMNWGEFKAGTGEMLRAMMREPFTDAGREQEAQRRRWNYDPEHLSNEAYQLNNDRHGHTKGLFGSKKLFADESLKAKKITPETLTQLKPRETSWTTQEALRQFQDTSTQGQSVH